MTSARASAAISPASPRAVAVALSVPAALYVAGISSDLLRPHLPAAPFGLPELRSAIVMLFDIALLLLAGLAAGGASLRSLAAIAGLSAPIAAPLAWAAAIFAAPALALLLLAGVAPEAGLRELTWYGFAGPFYEELFYRGLAVGLLMRLAGWPLIPAALLPALFFAAGHIYQGKDLQSLVGVLAITGIGGLFFAWLFVRWGFNLWPPFLIHAGLNSAWILFDLGETAIGGWLGNAVRGFVILAALASTIWLRRSGRLKPAQPMPA